MLNKIREDAQSVPMNIEFKLQQGLCTIEDQDAVLALNNPEMAYLFARDVPGANIDRCQEAACKDSWRAYWFARDIPGADIEKCQEAVCKNPVGAYYFARDIPGADKKKIRKVLIGTGFEGRI